MDDTSIALTESEVKELLFKKLKNRDQLRRWCKTFLDVDLSDCIVSRFSTSTPLDMVWDIYNFCATSTPDTSPLTTIYVAGRASQKTLSCAVLQILLPLYSYFKKFATKKYIKDYLKDQPKISKTIFVINQKEIEVEILPITEASVQGPHQPAVSIDELSSLAPNKLAAYPSISGIPIYTEDQKPWVQFGISSRKGRYTIIETEYEQKDKTGTIFKFWTVLENTQKCPDKISGVEDYSYYVNINENKAITADEFLSLDNNEQGKYERVNAKKGCFQCPMKVVCGGDAKKQTSNCRSLKPIQATITEFKKSDYEWFLSQKMSLQPSSEDLVYPKFSKEIFEKTPREMYAIFTGRDPNLEISEDDLIREMIKHNVKKYAGVDHGYTHPFAIVIIYEDAVGNIYIMKVHEQSGLEPPEVVEVVQKLKNKYQFTHVYPDTASPAINKMLSKIIRVGDDFNKSPSDGIALIRQKMCPNYGPTKLYGLKGNCDTLINNFVKYHFAYDSGGKLTDKVVKEFDDSHDALSYAAQNRWNKGKPIVNDSAAAVQSAQDHFNPKPENEQTYQEKVKKQYDNWLSQQIRQSTQEQGGSTGIKTSKSKSHFWDID